MSIKRKSREEIKLMKMAGNVVALVHQEMKKIVKPGLSTKYLDDIAFQIIRDNKCEPTFLGYNGFPGSICTSINDMVVHGIPSEDVIIKDGDIISIDVGATFRGYVGDSAWTYPVGEVKEETKKLLQATEQALYAAIAQAKENNTLDDIGSAIEKVAKASNFGIVREYGGHGVGSKMHEEPFIFNYATGNKTVLKSGYTIAIEPMINLGCDEVYTLEDKWGVVTKDRKPSAHFEHTVLVTEYKAEILTKLLD